MTKILLASLLGSLVCVLWGAVSWMGLTWHDSVLRDFHDEAAVAATLNANAGDNLKRRGEVSGVFIMPRGALTGAAAPVPDETAAMKATSTRKPVDNSMFVFAVVRPGAHQMKFGITMAWIFARSFVACLMISLMLSATLKLDYLQRVVFCVLGGAFSGLVADAPLMVWFQMPLRYTITNFADHLCEWALAGIVIAAFVEGRNIWEKIR